MNKKLILSKKLISIIIVILFLCSSKNAFASESVYLDISGIEQEESNWCWAASSQCIIDYLGSWSPTPSQSDIVTHIKGSPVNEPAGYNEIHSSIHDYCVDSTDVNSYVSWSTVKNSIGGWYSPMHVGITYTLGGGHSMVMYGYYEDSSVQNVSYMDPFPANPRWNSRTYSSFKYNISSHWTRTFYYCYAR
jgi:hypothetical protein